jgi:hypothetical protein
MYHQCHGFVIGNQRCQRKATHVWSTGGIDILYEPEYVCPFHNEEYEHTAKKNGVKPFGAPISGSKQLAA